MANKKSKKTKPNKKKKSVSKKRTQKKIVSTIRLLRRTGSRLKQNWRPILILLGFYVALQLLLNNSAAQSEQSGSLVAIFVGGLFSMMFIYIARESAREEKRQTVSARSAAYRGPQQIVPFLLLSLLSVAQLLPFAIGAFIFQIGVAGGVAIFIWEQLIFGAIWLILALPSAYWLTTTLFSLVIGAIPNVTPMQAWRAAKKLVKPYLFQVTGRLFVAISIGVILLGIALYVILLTSNATMMFTIINVLFALMLPVAWVYVFELYLELLKHEQK